MNRLPALVWICLLAAGSWTLAQAPPGNPANPSSSAELALLAAWMEGSFSSQAQAQADPDFRDIRLAMARIWRDRTDAVWLYVEQAVAETPAAPYRQRIYRVAALGEGFFESRVYSFEDPAPFVGAWKNPALLADLTPARLSLRDGCSLVLRRKGDAFIGSTLASLCPSERRGAAYATSEAEITADTLRSWDRGFDTSGKQVWGSEKGPYVFRKIAPDAPPAESPGTRTESQ